MCEDDFGPFAALLDAAYALYGKSLPAEAKAVYFRALADWSLETLRSALNAHVKDAQRGQFAPKPADLIAQLEGHAANDGRPEADEAWAIALGSQDEVATVVWTTEMAEAFGIVRPVLEQGDKVGARMAFKDAYKRLVEAARREQHNVHWQTSLGWDAEQRTVALNQAVSARRITASAAAALLPPPDHADDGYDTKKAHANLQRLRKQLAAMPSAWQRARTAREARLHEERKTAQTQKNKVLNHIDLYMRVYPDKLPIFPRLTYDRNVFAWVHPACRCPVPSATKPTIEKTRGERLGRTVCPAPACRKAA